MKYVGTNQAYQRPKDVVKPFKLVPFKFKLQRLVFISEILINKKINNAKMKGRPMFSAAY